jgi:tetratricopeptide (TPR) repeat protein
MFGSGTPVRAVRIDGAIGAFRSALELDPDNADALLGLGSALVRKNALTDAIVVLERAAARGETPGNWNRLGLAQTLVGRFAAERDSLERASRLNPTDLKILSDLALLGHSERAIVLDSRVVHSGVEQHQVRSVVAALVLAGRPDDAREIADHNLAHRDTDDLLSQVATIRAMRTPEARAQALGGLIG